MADEKRLQVINHSIFIERFVSSALAGLLDIDIETSKTLGNKSSAFSFRQKLDLLTDIKATDKAAVTKFQIFAEIRNQFAHNYFVKDFTTCFSYLDGAEGHLRKSYKIDGLEKMNQEQQLTTLYAHLFKDIIDNSHSILEKIEEKFINRGREQGKKEVYEYVVKEIKTLAEKDEAFNEVYSKIIDEAMSQFQKKETSGS